MKKITTLTIIVTLIILILLLADIWIVLYLQQTSQTRETEILRLTLVPKGIWLLYLGLPILITGGVGFFYFQRRKRS